MNLNLTTEFHHTKKTGRLKIFDSQNGEMGDGKYLLCKFFSSAEEIENIESELEKIAFQIREFRIKNFPETDNIN